MGKHYGAMEDRESAIQTNRFLQGGFGEQGIPDRKTDLFEFIEDAVEADLIFTVLDRWRGADTELLRQVSYMSVKNVSINTASAHRRLQQRNA